MRVLKATENGNELAVKFSTVNSRFGVLHTVEILGDPYMDEPKAYRTAEEALEAFSKMYPNIKFNQ